MKTFTLKALTVLCALLLLNVTLVRAQNFDPELHWQKTLGGSGDEDGRSVQKTLDGGYIIVGFSESTNGDVSFNHGESDIWAVKLDSNLAIQWEKSLGGSEDDFAHSVILASDGGYILAGSTFSNDGDVSANHGALDAWVVKLDSLGNIVWQKTYGGSESESIRRIQASNDGGYLFLASSSSNDGDLTENQGEMDYWIVKINAQGLILWQTTYGGSYIDYPLDIELTKDGGTIVSGFTNSRDGDVTHTGNIYYRKNLWLVKLDSIGSLEWEKIYIRFHQDYGVKIHQTKDGGYAIVGHSYADNGPTVISQMDYDSWILKTDSIGNQEWKTSFGGKLWDLTHSSVYTKDGGFVLAAFITSTDGLASNLSGNGDICLLKFNAAGQFEWEKTFGGSSSEVPRQIIEENDGSYSVIGNTRSNDGDVTGHHSNKDFWLINVKTPKGYAIGTVFQEDSINCLKDAFEFGVPNYSITQTLPHPRVVNTSNNGVFHLPIFDTVPTVFGITAPQYLNHLITNNCTSSYTVQLDSTEMDTGGLNFGLEVVECPLLIVEVSSNRRRPCFQSTTTVSYRNDGFADQTNVIITVELPDYVNPISASKTYLMNSQGQLEFYLYNVNAGESGIITILDLMDCELTLSNTEACTKAWISPENTCYNQIVTPNPLPWDSTDINLTGSSLVNSSNENCYQFVIANTGIDMQDSFAFNLFSGNGFLQSDSFLLGNNDSLVVLICGIPYAQMTINQHVSHPSSKTIFSIPPNPNNGPSISVYDYTNFDEQLESSIECLTVVNAYDPNDKNATPQGWATENFVPTDMEIDYKIRFQNTGNDTAYNVEIIDTVDATIFDITKLILGGSSHPYQFSLSGDSGIVVFSFKFNNINLVDSFTNEAQSHGFVNFKIGAYDTIPQGTVANNFADIYFDFNPAIRTNTSTLTLQDTIPIDTKTKVTISQEYYTDNGYDLENINWTIYPNPSTQSFSVNLDGAKLSYNATIINGIGKTILRQFNMKDGDSILIEEWSEGVYYILLKSNNGVVLGRKKLVITK